MSEINYIVKRGGKRFWTDGRGNFVPCDDIAPDAGIKPRRPPTKAEWFRAQLNSSYFDIGE